MGCGERKDRVSGIPIVQLFWHWGLPSFEGRPRLWGLS
jgi:hypothetical protein